MAFEVRIPTGKGGDGGGSSGPSGLKQTNKLLKKLDKSVLATVDIGELLMQLFGDILKLFTPIVKLLSLMFLVIFLPLLPLLKGLMKGIAWFIKQLMGSGGDLGKFMGHLIIGLLLTAAAIVIAALGAPIWLLVGIIILAAVAFSDAIFVLIDWIKIAGVWIWDQLVAMWELWKEAFFVGIELWKFIFQWVHDTIMAGWEFMKNIGGDIWNFLMTGLAFISNLGSMLWDWFKGALAGIANLGSMIWDYIKNVFGGEGSDGSVTDGVIQNGKIISIHPEDTVMAFKDEVSRRLQLNANRGFS